MPNGSNGAGEPRERLFRDDAGAALERAVRLEEENAELRREIERLKRSRGDTPTVRIRPAAAPRSFGMGLTISGALLGVAFATALVGRSARHAHPPPPLPPTPIPIATYVPVPPTPIVYAPPRSTVAPLAQETCAVPYFFDASGVKHYKVQCLKK